ncbi:DMT family transporter [Pseudoduganella aquatica]|uniref:Guanidinium exporter n=1 Tax=Pseudoduganella aquatica TaxID=2660641 RepID=A0A7X4H8K0_9BURK|nr:SMR family transporter [Pseudoduganella aquatica]MYN06644.1 QacE family quaternary ammonium compound efflux SMR transporter [Pseudoduganella aquatica]
MAWTILLAAALVDIAMAVALKYAEGWTRFWPSVAGLVFANGAIALLAISLRQLPVGTAFAVFTGLGAAGAALIGIAAFGESASPLRLLLIAAIIACIAGLKLAPA